MEVTVIVLMSMVKVAPYPQFIVVDYNGVGVVYYGFDIVNAGVLGR